MIISRTNAQDTDFRALTQKLDKELSIIDGDEHSFYSKFNGIDSLKYAVMLSNDDTPIACGALKEIRPESMEVKRMYVLPDFRGRGIATQILRELEIWAKELGYSRCMLETGKRQKDAIALYEKNGYQKIPNYDQYIGIENSVCFSKDL